MKIYANDHYDAEWEFLQSIIGQDIWVRAFVALGYSYVDCYIKPLGVQRGRMAIQAQEYNKSFSRNWYDGIYYVEPYQIDLMQPVQIYTDEDIKEYLGE